MKNIFSLCISLSILINAAPMESLDDYNVYLIHGTGSRWGGLDCENGDNGKDYTEANKNLDPLTGYSIPIGGRGDDSSPATGMIKQLNPWIRDTLFEGDFKNAIYFQRPFTDPANSPKNNAKETGLRTWIGNDKCKYRRSLFEEAQEVKAGGQAPLASLRNDSLASYRKIPSRNIIISHSMGGVASREYVQGDYYNSDVDKVILLDSPNEGTHSLEGLLDLKKWYSSPFTETVTQTMATSLAFGIAGTFLNGGPIVDNIPKNRGLPTFVASRRVFDRDGAQIAG